MKFDDCGFLNINNNTFCSNIFPDGGILMTFKGTSPVLSNNIFKGNTGAGDKLIRFWSVDDFPGDAPLEGEITNNLFEGGLGAIAYNGMNGVYDANIDEDPLFKDINNANFRLSENSPCINAGAPDTTGLHIPFYDVDGHARISGDTIDMGAYENQQDLIKITLQPVRQEVCAGDSAALEVKAEGEMVNYQWQKEGLDVQWANREILSFRHADVDDRGFYYCLITLDNFTLSSDTVWFEVFESPGLHLAEDTTISTADTLIIDAGNGYASYLWNTGSEEQSVEVIGIDAGIYPYNVLVSDTNQCYASDTMVVTIVSLPTSITDIPDNIGIKIYPNPARDILYLKTSEIIRDQVMIRILDNSGRVLLTRDFDQLLNTIEYPLDVSGLPYGEYYLQMNTGKIQKVEKIVIK
jgi:hypothetical protein